MDITSVVSSFDQKTSIMKLPDSPSSSKRSSDLSDDRENVDDDSDDIEKTVSEGVRRNCIALK